jgi:maleate isomerase
MAQAAMERGAATGGAIYRDDLSYELGPELGHRAAIGLIVLAVDSTIEHDYRAILPLDGIALYITRIPFPNQVTPETLAAMEADLIDSAALIHPGRRLDVLAFGCTSGTIVIGEDETFAKLREVRPGIECTSPMTAGVAGCKALGCKSMALITPYTRDINQMFRDFLEARGVTVPVMATFNNPNDGEVARISDASLRDAILDVGRAEVDAVFVSCSSLHVTPVIEECEAALDKPVMSSNQAMAWHSLRLAGVDDKIPGFGRLLRV